MAFGVCREAKTRGSAKRKQKREALPETFVSPVSLIIICQLS